MLRVRNTHKAPVAGIGPGAIGDVDEKNPGAKIYLAAEHLVPVDKTTPVTPSPMTDKLVELHLEIVERTARTLAQMQAERDGAITRRIRELEDAASGQSDKLQARIAELEAQLAKGKKSERKTDAE